MTEVAPVVLLRLKRGVDGGIEPSGVRNSVPLRLAAIPPPPNAAVVPPTAPWPLAHHVDGVQPVVPGRKPAVELTGRWVKRDV